MSDCTNMQNMSIYKSVVKATDSIESPSIGFEKPTEYKGTNAGPLAIIKQNNTQIQLLAQIAEEIKETQTKLKDIKGYIRHIKDRDEASTSEGNGLSEDIISKLEKLSLGEPVKKEKHGHIRVFNDPLKILKEEKQKLK